MEILPAAAPFVYAAAHHAEAQQCNVHIDPPQAVDFALLYMTQKHLSTIKARKRREFRVFQ